jgi:hypothetical protein
MKHLMKIYIFILLSISSVNCFGQLDEFVRGDYYHDYIVEKNNDTTFLRPVKFHFPIQDYLDINSDIATALMLSCYSKTMQCLKEPILYKLENRKFLRIKLLEQGRSISYRLERIDQNNFKLIVKKIKGNYENASELTTDSLIINNKEYLNITDPIYNSIIWSIKPNSVQFYALSEDNLILFESNLYGGYHFTDIYIPFTEKNKLFKNFYKGLEKIKTTANTVYSK